MLHLTTYSLRFGRSVAARGVDVNSEGYMDIISLVEEMKTLPDCEMLPPSGLPMLRSEHVLSNDLKTFYELCGGFIWTLMVGSTFRDSFSVLPPRRVLLANPIVTCISEEELAQYGRDDISWDWYTIAQTANGDFFTIDLNPNRLGRCYDSFHETHASPGDSPILGFSFTEFLCRMMRHIQSSKATEWNWEETLKSISLEDAYD